MTTVSLRPKISQVNKLPRKKNSPMSDRKDPTTCLIVHSDEAMASAVVNLFIFLRREKACREGVYEEKRGVGKQFIPFSFWLLLSKCLNALKFQDKKHPHSFPWSWRKSKGGTSDLSVASSGPWALIGNSPYRFSKISPTKVHVTQTKVSFPLSNFLFMLLSKPIQGKFCLL